MRLRLTDVAYPEEAGALSSTHREQLVACAHRYDGARRTPEDLLRESETDDTWRGFVEVWRVNDEDGVHRYTLWLYQVDSGTMFDADTTNVVVEIIQFGFQSRDRELASALSDAIDSRPERGHSALPYLEPSRF